MQLDVSTLGLYVATVITMIAVPGPVVLLVTGAGMAGGPGLALRTIFGTNAASLILIAISGFLIKGLLSISETVFLIIKLAGCLYIAYVAVQILLEPAASAGQHDGAAEKARSGGFLKGFIMGISNPKDIVFFASFFPQFINLTPDVNASLALLTLVWIILDFSTLMLVYSFISKVAKPATHYKILKISGVLLLLIACYGATTSVYALKML